MLNNINQGLDFPDPTLFRTSPAHRTRGKHNICFLCPVCSAEVIELQLAPPKDPTLRLANGRTHLPATVLAALRTALREDLRVTAATGEGVLGEEDEACDTAGVVGLNWEKQSPQINRRWIWDCYLFELKDNPGFKRFGGHRDESS